MRNTRYPRIVVAAVVVALLCAGAMAQSSVDPLARAIKDKGDGSVVTPAEEPPNTWYTRGYYLPERMHLVAVTADLYAGFPWQTSFAYSPADRMTPVKDQARSAGSYIFAGFSELESRMVADEGGDPLAPQYDFSEQDTLNFYGEPAYRIGGNGFLLNSYLSLFGTVRETVEPWIEGGVAQLWESDASVNVKDRRVTEWEFLGDFSLFQTVTFPDEYEPESINIRNLKRVLMDRGPVVTSVNAEAGDNWAINWRSLVVPSSVKGNAATNDTAVVLVGWDDLIVHHGADPFSYLMVSDGVSYGATDVAEANYILVRPALVDGAIRPVSGTVVFEFTSVNEEGELATSQYTLFFTPDREEYWINMDTEGDGWVDLTENSVEWADLLSFSVTSGNDAFTARIVRMEFLDMNGRGAWKVKGNWGERVGYQGYSWVGYGALGIGAGTNVTVDYAAADNAIPLRIDEGWDGETIEHGGRFMLVKYTAPQLPTGQGYALAAVDVFNPSHRYTDVEIRVFGGFDKAAQQPTGEYVNARTTSTDLPLGLRSVDLAQPVPVSSGQTVVIQIAFSTDADHGGFQILPVSEPRSAITPEGGAGGIYNDIARAGDYLYLAGTELAMVNVSDPAWPRTIHSETLPGTGVRVVTIRDRLVAVQYAGAQGQYDTPNTDIDVHLDAAEGPVEMDLPFDIFDVYNPTSWREVMLQVQPIDSWWKHPDVPAEYNDGLRTILNDPALAVEGNTLYLMANRYQDRRYDYDATTQRYRYWWDFCAMRWLLTDTYNLTPTSDIVFNNSSVQTGSLVEHQYWYHDYDATGRFDIGPDGLFYGPGYRLNPGTSAAEAGMYLDKNPDSYLWDRDGDGFGDSVVVASIVNSWDASVFNRVTNSPGDPGDIQIVDYSQSPPVRLSRIGAGDGDEALQLPFPAEDLSIVDNLMFVADAQAGIVVVDITDPRNPAIVGEYMTAFAQAIEAWRDPTDDVIYVYAADRYAGLVVVTYRESGPFVNLNQSCWYSRTGEPGTWKDVYELHQKALVLRGRLRPTGGAALTPIEDLIAHYYSTVLGRDPEPGALEAWRDGFFNYSLSFDIDARFISREMGRQFFLSPEYAARNRSDTDFLRDCYETFLGRTPTDAELKNWLGGEWNRAQVVTIFAESEEAGDLFEQAVPGYHGDPVRNLVTSMYIGVLDRIVDSGGLDAWAERLYGAPDLKAVSVAMAAELFNSKEYQERPPTQPYTPVQDQVVRAYRAFLSRYPADSELEYWSGELNAGRVTIAGMIAGFAESQEFESKLNDYFGQTP